MKHNISITMDQKLFRELELIRGREKRSTFIEHLLVLGLKDYTNNNKKTMKTAQTEASILSLPRVPLNHEKS
jgi:metal-responsive CopG/Arc/MetJ family transcriptional regulator